MNHLVQDSLSDGANLVMFSGDKLFGSVQSGMIAGDDNLVNEIKIIVCLELIVAHL